jgi:hypothetical protein
MDGLSILIIFIVFVCVWDGIFGKDSFVGTMCMGGLCYGMGQTLMKWVGMPPDISFNIATVCFVIVVVYMHIHDRRLRIEIEERHNKMREDRVIYDKKVDEALEKARKEKNNQ